MSNTIGTKKTALDMSSPCTGSLAQLEKYENLLFKMGAMNKAPCFKCGYNGQGYYQPLIHKCAEKHHRLCEEQ